MSMLEAKRDSSFFFAITPHPDKIPFRKVDYRLLAYKLPYMLKYRIISFRGSKILDWDKASLAVTYLKLVEHGLDSNELGDKVVAISNERMRKLYEPERQHEAA